MLSDVATLRTNVKIDESLALVELGGSYVPGNCNPRERLAVLVPLRGRADALPGFLAHLHFFLQQQNKAYTIVVIEQTANAPFNRASLLNVGAIETMRRVAAVNCLVLHDVDVLPLNLLNDYSCAPGAVRQLLRSRSDRNFTPFYGRFMGGVVSLTPRSMSLVNGLSNAYWGWGGEDDDFERRVLRAGLRFELVTKQRGRMDDGLSSVRYTLLRCTRLPTYTLLLVELHQQEPYQAPRGASPEEPLACD
ncbi:beta-1,4-galactosyltransferase 3-like [Hyalella azteca]|uniref:Beta-1,4-galactosyltransferase 3-like n=1 Tax=Hyalella azteca TaxID=294128 RepID=A0A8B7PIK6_HYAAZ|nr:beta-1,4-galactosyltransferase 3-like [Hyalella azteca]